MIVTVSTALAQLAVSQAQSGSGGVTAAVIVAVVAAAAAVFAFIRARATDASLAKVQAELTAANEEQRKTAESDRRRAKDLDEKRDEIVKLKKDLAAQRKKTHEAQTQGKELRTELSSQREVFDKRVTSRPAFAEPEKAPAAAKPAPKPEPEKAPPVSGITMSEIQDKAKRVEEQNLKLTAELDAARGELETERKELKKLRRRTEDYRRIDVVSQGKVAALEDRINHLGRQYYEACTEIAVLKGEVPRVPPPVELPTEAPTTRVRDDDNADADDSENVASEADARDVAPPTGERDSSEDDASAAGDDEARADAKDAKTAAV